MKRGKQGAKGANQNDANQQPPTNQRPPASSNNYNNNDDNDNDNDNNNNNNHNNNNNKMVMFAPSLVVSKSIYHVSHEVRLLVPVQLGHALCENRCFSTRGKRHPAFGRFGVPWDDDDDENDDDDDDDGGGDDDDGGDDHDDDDDDDDDAFYAHEKTEVKCFGWVPLSTIFPSQNVANHQPIQKKCAEGTHDLPSKTSPPFSAKKTLFIEDIYFTKKQWN